MSSSLPAAYNSTLTALRPKVTLNASDLRIGFLLRANHAGNSTAIASAYDLAANLAIMAKSGGLILSPGSGLTWSVVHPVAGANGRIVKRGAGNSDVRL